MKYEARTHKRENKSYGVWNNDMQSFQHVYEWGGTETINLETANKAAADLNYLSLVNTWVRAFNVSLVKPIAMKRRLKELRTWDAPKVGNEIEHKAKIHALIKLTAQY